MGRGLRAWREHWNVSQARLGDLARPLGLDWSRDVVAAIERGNRTIGYTELGPLADLVAVVELEHGPNESGPLSWNKTSVMRAMTRLLTAAGWQSETGPVETWCTATFSTTTHTTPPTPTETGTERDDRSIERLARKLGVEPTRIDTLSVAATGADFTTLSGQLRDQVAQLDSSLDADEPTARKHSSSLIGALLKAQLAAPGAVSSDESLELLGQALTAWKYDKVAPAKAFESRVAPFLADHELIQASEEDKADEAEIVLSADAKLPADEEAGQ